MNDLNNRRWAAVADCHLPSIASSLKRIAKALEAINGREVKKEEIRQRWKERQQRKEEQCIGETFSKAESLGWENPLDKVTVTDDTDPQIIDAAEEEALAFLAEVKGIMEGVIDRLRS